MADSGLKRLSELLRRKMPQLATLWVESGIPEIKRLLLPRKRAPEIRLSFRGDTPRVGAFIERDGACRFPCFVGQVRYLRGHSGPHQKSAPHWAFNVSALGGSFLVSILLPQSPPQTFPFDAPVSVKPMARNQQVVGEVREQFLGKKAIRKKIDDYADTVG